MNSDKDADKNVSSSKIGKVAGSSILLPGESGEKYQLGFHATVEELGAKTPLQVYLAEKIFQCLWWMRRYETQKRSSIIAAMANALKGHLTSKEERLAISNYCRPDSGMNLRSRNA